jgi:penicillin-binding protein 1A
MVGSRDFTYQGFGQDNAATSFIQPGSSIKPLVFAQLFQNQGEGKQNFGSGSILADTSTTFEGGYKPQDADGSFKGNISIRTGLDLSRNIPAIKAMAIAGKDATWKTIRDLGDKSYCTQGPEAQAGLSSAIGGCGTRMVDHVNALASLGRMGVYTPWTGVLEVRSSTGEVLKKYKTEQKQVIDPQAAYIVSDILGDSNARRPLIGSDTTVNIDRANVKVAIKTGTSDRDKKPKDIWGTGYTPSLAMNVWLGNPDTSPLTNGNSRIPLYVMDKVMAYATQLYRDQGKIKADNEWFIAPEGIQKIGNEVFPSYYNKKQSVKTASMSFDRVSKKLATECTPAGAKIDIGVSKTIDPYTKKEVSSATDGYDATKSDDAHSCTDAKPSIAVNLSPNGKTASVSYANGTFGLQTVEVKAGDTVIASKQVSSAGTWDVQIPASISGSFTVTAIVTDAGYYSAQDSDSR